MSLTPTLTLLDQRVLDALEPERTMAGHHSRSATSVRLAEVARRVGEPADEVKLILRGLEAIGAAEHRNGWWTRRRTA